MKASAAFRSDDAFVALVLAALAFVLAWGGWVWRADRVVYDAGLSLWSRPAPDDIVIVAIDDASIDAIGRWPWTRSVHATLVERLAAVRPRAVALDLLLSEPDPDPRQDELLAAALGRLASGVMPVTWQAVPGEPLRALEPVAPLRARVRLGAAEAAVDADGVLRHAFLESGAAGRRLPHLAVALLGAGGELVHPRLAVEQLDEPSGARDWRRQGRFLVRYLGPPGHVRHVSYADVLRGDVPASALTGRYLLVGMTAQGLGDTLATPVNAGQRAMPGVEVLAHTLHTLRSGTAPRPVAALPAGAMSALLVAALVTAFALAGTRMALLVALVSLPLALLASLGALAAGWWWSPVSFGLAAALAYPLWSWRRLERGVDRLDAEIAAMAAEPGLLAPPVPVAAAGADRLATRLAALRTAAETLRSAQRFLADALAGLPTAMLVDDGQGRVLLANPLAARLFDVDSADELRGLDLARLLGEFECHPAPDWPQALAQVRRTHEDLAVQAHTPDHGDHVIHATGVEMHAGTRLIVAIADVTPIKQAERAREELLAFVTHDLRAPAISIALLAELQLQGRGVMGPEALMHEMRRLAQRTLSMADDFVRIAQAEQRPLQVESVPLAALQADVVADFEPQAAAAGVQLAIDPDTGATSAPMDRELVRRALGNLLSNAIRHSPAAGRIELVARARVGGCRLQVRDQGPGLSPEAMARLMAAGTGLAPGSRQGVGFGLLFVQRVAARHQGRLEVARAEGGGALFTLDLGTPSGNP
ncbi:MAG: CHASE2 domain-containing protein [Rubrivivax sp.]